jgi:hypothetical protein
MPYPESHWYLTVHWQQQEETGQFGLRFINSGTPAQADVDAVAGTISAWWTASSAAVPGGYQLTFLRLAHIGTDGRYIPGSIAYDHIYAPVVAGGGGTGINFPPQCSFCVSLRSDLPRGIAHAGRIYTPPLALSLAANLKWPTANVNSAIATLGATLSALSGGVLGTLAIYSKGTPAVPGGARTLVTHINADTRPDVQRRRGKSMLRVMSTDTAIT